MDDAPRPPSEQFQDSTRSLLIVLVVVSVLAAGVLAAADVPGLIGNKWQAVGAASAALTVAALLFAVFVVLRALDPVVEETVEPEAAPDNDADQDGADTFGDASPFESVVPSIEGPTRRAQRQSATRYQRARSWTAFAVLLAFLGMTGMTVAAVADGNKVESRQRRLLAEELALDDDGPITEPHAVAVQFTTGGLQRVADAMTCTGGEIGARPVQGWAVSGTYRNPTVVLFAPAPACDSIEIALAPRDGFVYPLPGSPDAAVTTTTTSTTTSTTLLATSTSVPAASITPTTIATP